MESPANTAQISARKLQPVAKKTCSSRNRVAGGQKVDGGDRRGSRVGRRGSPVDGEGSPVGGEGG